MLDEELVEAIKCALRKSGGGSTAAAKLLGMSTTTFWRRCQKLNIGERRPGGRGNAVKKPALPIDEILAGLHPNYSATGLKERLFKEGIKDPRCEICNSPDTWQGKPLTLQLDHIDGDRRNHRSENLRIVCPNCHSQTPTYAGKLKWLNSLPEDELRNLVKVAHEKSATLREAGDSIGVSAGQFRKLLMKFGL